MGILATRLCIVLLIILGDSLTWNSLAAEQARSELPKILLDGFSAYKAEGAEAALKTWLKGSPMEGEKQALSQVNALLQIESLVGKYLTYHPIHNRALTPTTQIVFLVVDYEKGPLFGVFVLYKAADGWIAFKFDFNLNPWEILPPALMVRGAD